ncbi:alpha/beta hydrolase [Devosia geojensis]|uniref:alpha/beta hydrolase n=1 Tax=Devosia geojensis TaxID=443610 RepID=UPI0006971155|nr:alpha/beta hydrolase [Devosia geojensis]
MRKRMIAILVAVAGLFVVYVVGGGIFFNHMLNRILVVGNAVLATPENPEATPYDLSYRGDPREAFGFDFETVAIATEGGEAPAWLVRPQVPSRDVWAIFVHGIAGTREGGYRYLPALHAAGYPALMITYRNDVGAPSSPQGIYSFGLTEWPDLDAAVEYALANGAARVIIAADSMGGGVLGQFLKNSGHAGNVEALLMDSPALDFPAIARSSAEAFHLPFAGLLAKGAQALFAIQHGVDLSEAEVLPNLAAFPGPVMLVHGSGDRIVPIGISERLLTMRYGQTLFLRTHADHLQSRAENPERYDRTLKAFLAALPGEQGERLAARCEDVSSELVC